MTADRDDGPGDPDSVSRMLNRVTQLLGVEHPIIQAPMGYIARAQLASAVSNAGALGIIETSSGQLDQVRDEIAKMRDLTDLMAAAVQAIRGGTPSLGDLGAVVVHLAQELPTPTA